MHPPTHDTTGPDVIAQFQRLARHGAWADARLLAAARRAEGDRSTVLRELAHVRGAQETWLARIEGRPSTLPVWPTLSLAELETVGQTVDATMHAVLAGLTATALAGEVAYTTSAGVAHRTPLVDVLLQLFTHGQYHRGKANAALRAIGAEAAGVDFISWAREGEPSARPPAPSR